MKAILEFNLDLPEDKEELAKALKASDLSAALFSIRQEVFRPARKHGYADYVGDFYSKQSEELQDKFNELVGLLEAMYTDVLKEYDVLELEG